MDAFDERVSQDLAQAVPEAHLQVSAAWAWAASSADTCNSAVGTSRTMCLARRVRVEGFLDRLIVMARHSHVGPGKEGPSQVAQ